MKVSMKKYVDSRFAASKEAVDRALHDQQTYVNTRFTASKEAVDAALVAQQSALAAALASQQRELSSQIGLKHDTGSSRREAWGYVIAGLGMLIAVASLVWRH
jgi:hypothetical protein